MKSFITFLALSISFVVGGFASTNKIKSTNICVLVTKQYINEAYSREEGDTTSRKFFCSIYYESDNVIHRDTIRFSNSDSLCFTLPISYATCITLSINERDERYVIQPGKNVKINLLNLWDRDGENLELSTTYFHCIDTLMDIWRPIDRLTVADNDSVTYNLLINKLLKQGYAALNHNLKNVPKEIEQKLSLLNQFKWAEAYAYFAEIKRKTQVNKRFNKVASHYLKPLLPLINEQQNLDECKELKKDLLAFYNKLTAYNFETRLFSDFEKNCMENKGRSLHPDNDIFSCGWGYKENDNWINDIRYQEAEDFNKNGIAIITVNGRKGAINGCFQLVVQPVYDDLKWFTNRLLICKQDAKYGLINIEGQELIKPQYEELSEPHGYATLLIKKRFYLSYKDSNGSYLLIDTTGKVVSKRYLQEISYTYSDRDEPIYIRLFKQGNDKNGITYQICDSNGTPIVKDSFINVHPLKGYLMLEKSAHQFYLIKDTTPPLIVDTFDMFRSIPKLNDIRDILDTRYDVEESNYYLLSKGGKTSVVNHALKHLSDCKYKNVLGWGLGAIYIRKNNKTYLLNLQGEIKYPVGFDTIIQLTKRTYQATAGDTLYIFDKDYNFLFKLKAKVLYLSGNINKQKETGHTLIAKGMFTRIDDYLYQLISAGNNIVLQKLIPGTYSLLSFPSIFGDHPSAIFFMNPEGLIMEQTYSEGDDTRNFKELLYEYIISDRYKKDNHQLLQQNAISKVTLKDRSGEYYLYGIQSGKYSKLMAVLDKNTVPKQITINYWGTTDTVDDYPVVFYLFRTGTNKYGIITPEKNLALDTIYDEIVILDNYIAAYNNKNQILSFFNKQFKLIDKINNPPFQDIRINEKLMLIYNKKGGQDSYFITDNSLKKIPFNQLRIDEQEPILWGYQRKGYDLYDSNLNLITTLQTEHTNSFSLGYTQVNGILISKKGAIVQRGNDYNAMSLNFDIRKQLSKVKDMNSVPENAKNVYTLTNLSDMHFSTYSYQPGKQKNRTYIAQLADDKRFPSSFINAINTALHYTAITEQNSDEEYSFNYHSPYLFNIQYEYNRRSEISITNYFILNDTLYRLSPYPEYELIETSLLSTMLFNKLKNVAGFDDNDFWRNKRCIIPEQAFRHYSPEIELRADGVYFIIKNTESQNKKTPVAVKFSYDEMKPFANKESLLYKWISSLKK
ncbi:MAG: WG repeat-containing protein [Bacteroidota bacterium]